jgi:prepilin-type N-terminal cleavage/methylation domain-containing protein
VTARQEGFTIMEVIVALVLFAVVLTSLAGLSVAAARAAVTNSDAATRQAYSLELANRYMTLPWNALPTGQWSDTVGTPNNTYRRTYNRVSAGVTDTLIISVTPLQRGQQPETMRLIRTRP